MRKVQILGALFAVLAFSAIAVADASATLWLEAGVSPTKEVARTSHGTILLAVEDLFGRKASINCTGLFIGTVGPGNLDLVTLVEGLNKETDLISCTIESDANEICGKVNELVIVHVLNLPWKTELVLSGAKTLDLFLKTGTAAPGYETLCPKGLNGRCVGKESAEFTGNGVNGAKFTFLGVAPEECSFGLKTGKVSGNGEMLGATVS
jgi:hypothetical protein